MMETQPDAGRRILLVEDTAVNADMLSRASLVSA